MLSSTVLLMPETSLPSFPSCFLLPQIHLVYLRCCPLAFVHYLPKAPVCSLLTLCPCSPKDLMDRDRGCWKLLSCELKSSWISCFQHFSIFASLTFFQCSCEPCLEMPFAQTLHSKYRLAFLNHLPQTSCPQAASFVVFVKEASVIPKAWLQLRSPFVDFSQTFPVVLRAERRSPDIKENTQVYHLNYRNFNSSLDGEWQCFRLPWKAEFIEIFWYSWVFLPVEN